MPPLRQHQRPADHRGAKAHWPLGRRPDDHPGLSTWGCNPCCRSLGVVTRQHDAVHPRCYVRDHERRRTRYAMPEDGTGFFFTPGSIPSPMPDDQDHQSGPRARNSGPTWRSSPRGLSTVLQRLRMIPGIAETVTASSSGFTTIQSTRTRPLGTRPWDARRPIPQTETATAAGALWGESQVIPTAGGWRIYPKTRHVWRASRMGEITLSWSQDTAEVRFRGGLVDGMPRL